MLGCCLKFGWCQWKTPDINREHSYTYHIVLFCIGTLMTVQHLCQHIYPQRFCMVLLSETHDNMNHTPSLTMQTWQHTLSSFHHDVPLAINQVAAESVCDNWIGTCGKTTKIHSNHHTPEEFLFICFASLALLRAGRVLHSSVNWYRPILSMDLKKSSGTSFVKESANWYTCRLSTVCIHCSDARTHEWWTSRCKYVYQRHQWHSVETRHQTQILHQWPNQTQLFSISPPLQPYTLW